MVVGPSPVITPSRTIVSAWAAVLRQEGCGTSDVSADVVSGLGSRGRHNCTSQFLFFRSSISIRGMNERLTIRNSHSLIFRWLPIGRCEVGHGSGKALQGCNQHFHTGHERALTIRNWHSEIFTWLPIGRCEVGHGSGQGKLALNAPSGAKRPGVMRAIKGNIGAERAEKWNSVENIAIKQKDSARTSLNPVECGSKRVLFVAEARIKRRC